MISCIDVSFRTRALVTRDIHAIYGIERRVFANHWSFSQLYDVLSTSGVEGVVCEMWQPSPRVFGFLIFDLQKKQTQILNMAVMPGLQRCGGGSAMLQYTQSFAVSAERPCVVADVSDAALGTHLFLRACGFRAIAIHDWRDSHGRYATYRFIRSSASASKPHLSAREAHSRRE